MEELQVCQNMILWVAIKVTVYTPAVLNVWMGHFNDDAGLPSPKFHAYTRLPVVVFVKFTWWGITSARCRSRERNSRSRSNTDLNCGVVRAGGSRSCKVQQNNFLLRKKMVQDLSEDVKLPSRNSMNKDESTPFPGRICQKDRNHQGTRCYWKKKMRLCRIRGDVVCSCQSVSPGSLVTNEVWWYRYPLLHNCGRWCGKKMSENHRNSQL